MQSLQEKSDLIAVGYNDSTPTSSDEITNTACTCVSSADELNILGGDVANSISNMSAELTKVIAALNDQSGVEKLTFALFVVFIGALSAYIFNFLHWRYVQQRHNSSNLGRSLIDLIDKLEGVATKYWVSGHRGKCAEDEHMSEIQMKTLLRQIVKYKTTFVENMKCDDVGRKSEQLDSFVSEIFDIVTGDGFESIERTPSKSKAMKIARECSDARYVISTAIVRT
jgi:hypothetical protein